MGVISKAMFLDYMFQFLKVLVHWRSRCTFSPSNLKTSMLFYHKLWPSAPKTMEPFEKKWMRPVLNANNKKVY